MVVVSEVFLPVFYRLAITSTYEVSAIMYWSQTILWHEFFTGKHIFYCCIILYRICDCLTVNVYRIQSKRPKTNLMRQNPFGHLF